VLVKNGDLIRYGWEFDPAEGLSFSIEIKPPMLTNSLLVVGS
jgi:hypothetical protein